MRWAASPSPGAALLFEGDSASAAARANSGHVFLAVPPHAIAASPDWARVDPRDQARRYRLIVRRDGNRVQLYTWRRFNWALRALCPSGAISPTAPGGPKCWIRVKNPASPCCRCRMGRGERGAPEAAAHFRSDRSISATLCRSTLAASMPAGTPSLPLALPFTSRTRGSPCA